MKNKRIIISGIIGVSFMLFFFKHLIQALIEWFEIIPVSPKLYIWENEQLPWFRIFFEFIYTFWLYVIYSVLIFYAIKFFKRKNIRMWKLKIFNILLLLGILVLIHINSLPYKKLLSATHPQRLNFAFVEEFVIFTILIIISIKIFQFLYSRNEI